MHMIRTRLVALVLAVLLLLTGCDLESLSQRLDAYTGAVSYSEMTYTRPDMTQLETVLQESCAVAQKGESLDDVLTAIYAFYDEFDGFMTNYALANIRYCGNLTDTYWEAEYNYCAENAAAVDAALEELYCALAASPLRSKLETDEYFGPGYFDGYGETTYDETLLSLMEQETQLLSRYYELSEAAAATEYYSDDYFNTYGTQMAQLFVELVAHRQKIADYMGYDSYTAFAYDFYFYRDYTPAEAEDYMTRLGQTLYDTYCRVNEEYDWESGYSYCSELDTFRYVQKAADAMGGTVAEAFELLETAGLYDLNYGENKFDTSFEIFLWSYAEPFVFVSPYLDQSDKLTFAHEFGHFCNDYACGGSYAGTDVAEVHSQAMEYLSLCYSQDVEELTEYKLIDSLCTYMENAAYALFEHRVYGLTGEELTVENVMSLYKQIGTEFGFESWDWDSRDWVCVPHFFTEPMYMISYVVSNDLAMQIYNLEQQTPGIGLELYEQCLTSQDSYILTFAETYGLSSPFTDQRLQDLAETFADIQ